MDWDEEARFLSRKAALEARIGGYRNWVEPLAGRVCSRITIDLYAPPIVLWFMYDGPTARVEINVPFGFRLGPGEWQLDPRTDRPALGRLNSLIERRVTLALAREDGSLRVEFSDAAAIEVPPQGGHVEPWWYEVEDQIEGGRSGDIANAEG